MHVISGSALDQGTHTIAVLAGVAVVTYMLQRSHVLTVAPTLFFQLWCLLEGHPFVVLTHIYIWVWCGWKSPLELGNH